MSYHSADPPDESRRIIYGLRPVEEICRARPRDVAVVYIFEGQRTPEIEKAVATAKDRGISVEGRPRALVAQLAGKGAVHQGIVAVVGIYPYVSVEALLEQAADQPLLLVILDGITDPQNLGAVIRSAEVLGAHGVIVPARGSAPVGPGAVKASAGATERVKIARVENLLRTIDRLRAAGIKVLGAAAGEGAALAETDLTGPLAWVLGSEGKGMRESVARRCDGLVTIPQRGTVDSLNVAAAGAILLYEAARQRAVANKS